MRKNDNYPMINEINHPRKDWGKNLNNLIKSKLRPKPQPKTAELDKINEGSKKNMIAQAEWIEVK
jgi:hypothetical protein